MESWKGWYKGLQEILGGKLHRQDSDQWWCQFRDICPMSWNEISFDILANKWPALEGLLGCIWGSVISKKIISVELFSEQQWSITLVPREDLFCCENTNRKLWESSLTVTLLSAPLKDRGRDNEDTEVIDELLRVTPICERLFGNLVFVPNCLTHPMV